MIAWINRLWISWPHNMRFSDWESRKKLQNLCFGWLPINLHLLPEPISQLTADIWQNKSSLVRHLLHLPKIQKMMYKFLIRPVLFKFDPEDVHHFSFSFLKFIQRIPFVAHLFRSLYVVKSPALEREVLGIKFPNPVGLAAGFDKDAKLYKELS